MMRISGVLISLTVLAACGGADGPVSSFPEEGRGPEEFRIVPQAPLELPEDFATLPEPTPGAPSRADIDPNAEAIAALGGRVERTDGVPAADAALIAYATRAGLDPEIRSNSVGTQSRLFGVLPRRGGGGDTLDAFAEAERFRALGVRVPTAPPS